MPDDYETARKCSPSEHDLRMLLDSLAGLKEPIDSGAYVDAAQVTFVSADGYVLGEWWWDTESEVWRLDIRLWGDAR